MKGVEIIGTGSFVPEKILTNTDLESIVDTSDQWIRERTGIEERRICTGDEDTSYLAISAAVRAIDSCSIDVKDIDLIIVATVTPDGSVPSVACRVQRAIGADKAMAFDLNGACSGFLFAMDTAVQFIKNGTVDKALVIAAEGLTKMVDWSDRNTCVLFGDGAGAVVLSAAEEEYITNINCRSVGSKGDYITCNNSPMENLFVESAPREKMKLNGKEVYKFATKIMEQEYYRVLEETGLKPWDINHILPHQANLRMIESFSKKVSAPMSRFIINIYKRGNTSGSTIPIAMDEAFKNGRIKKGENIFVVAFGGGLTYGSALIKWNL